MGQANSESRNPWVGELVSKLGWALSCKNWGTLWKWNCESGAHQRATSWCEFGAASKVRVYYYKGTREALESISWSTYSSTKYHEGSTIQENKPNEMNNLMGENHQFIPVETKCKREPEQNIYFYIIDSFLLRPLLASPPCWLLPLPSSWPDTVLDTEL